MINGIIRVYFALLLSLLATTAFSETSETEFIENSFGTASVAITDGKIVKIFESPNHKKEYLFVSMGNGSIEYFFKSGSILKISADSSYESYNSKTKKSKSGKLKNRPKWKLSGVEKKVFKEYERFEEEYLIVFGDDFEGAARQAKEKMNPFEQLQPLSLQDFSTYSERLPCDAENYSLKNSGYDGYKDLYTCVSGPQFEAMVAVGYSFKACIQDRNGIACLLAMTATTALTTKYYTTLDKCNVSFEETKQAYEVCMEDYFENDDPDDSDPDGSDPDGSDPDAGSGTAPGGGPGGDPSGDPPGGDSGAIGDGYIRRTTICYREDPPVIVDCPQH